MNAFKSYWQTLKPEEKLDLALRAGTPANYLAQLAGGHRKAGASIIARLCQADPSITQAMLRPDLYASDSAVA